MSKELIARLRHIYADGDPITEEAADYIEQLSGYSEQLRQRVQELEKERECLTKDWFLLKADADSLTAERDELRRFIERISQYRSDKDWQLMHLEISEAAASVKEK